MITCAVRNVGDDAYRPQDFGESIIVERRIHQDGASVYKLKNKEGKAVSSRREDLVQMLDHFNIQVDNPMIILSQDAARAFLHTSNPQDKYKVLIRLLMIVFSEGDTDCRDYAGVQ